MISGKNIALTRWTFACKVMSLLFNMQQLWHFQRIKIKVFLIVPRVYTSCFYWNFSWYDLFLMIYWWRNRHLEVFYWKAKMWSRSFTQAIKYFNPKWTHVTSAHNLLANISHMTSSSHPIGEGNGNPLQCSCLENPRDRGPWWAAVYGVAQSQTRLKWLSSSRSSSHSRDMEFRFPCVWGKKEPSLISRVLATSTITRGRTWVEEKYILLSSTS